MMAISKICAMARPTRARKRGTDFSDLRQVLEYLKHHRMTIPQVVLAHIQYERDFSWLNFWQAVTAQPEIEPAEVQG